MPRIEFYGIPRQRTGVAETTAGGSTLGDVLSELAVRYPAFAAECVASCGGLAPQVAASVGGERFVREPNTPLGEHEVLLIMSADSGG